MTKQELDLMDSFGQLEIAVKMLSQAQRTACVNHTTVYSNYYSNHIKELETILRETKDKFYKILKDHEEDE